MEIKVVKVFDVFSLNIDGDLSCYVGQFINLEDAMSKALSIGSLGAKVFESHLIDDCPTPWIADVFEVHHVN